MLILNDHAIYNNRYRQNVLDELAARGIKVESFGIFDALIRLPGLILHLLTNRNGVVLSSNLRSNLFTLLFTRGQKVIILNGMGRYRRIPRARAALRLLLQLRSNTSVIIQNYADFRYFRRRVPGLVLEWVPGSGGTAKTTGAKETLVLVQRDNKIGLVAPNVATMLGGIIPTPELVIVGCTDQSKLAELFAGLPWRSTGYVAADALFTEGGTFVQPSGYGEGFPHTLADALVSGMDIWISNPEFLRYGLGRLGVRRTPLTKGWSRLLSTEAAADAVRADVIATRICDICENMRDNGHAVHHRR